jgi:type I restriction enzyme S subunit
MQDLLTRGIDENGNLRSEQTHKFKDSPLGRIPVEWDVKQLGFLCELIKDGTHLPPARVSEGPLLLGVYNIVNGKLTRSPSDTRVSWDFYKQMHENWSIQTDDVLLAIVGATIGKTCLAPSDFEAYTLQRSVALIRGKKGVLNNRFLLQYLKSPLFQSIIQTKTNTTAQAGLYLSKIADFNIPICPIEEQIAITAKLEEIGKLGESYQQTEEKLHSIKTALMQDLLTGKKRVTALLNDMERVT